MNLRDYQAEQLDAGRARMRAGVKRLLLQLPTGGGKTVMAATMLDNSAGRGLRSWFLVHRRELIEQTSATFAAMGIHHGVVGAGFPEAFDRMVQIGGVQTVVNRLDRLPAPDMIVIDEAHHATAGTWRRILDQYPTAWVVGLSATPIRLDGAGLDDCFDDLVSGPSTATLIERGHLSPYSYFAPGKPDLGGVHSSRGDWARGELAGVMDKPKLVGDVVEHYLRLAAGKQGIVFAVSIEHSKHIADAFIAAGVRAAHVDGSMADRERGALVAAFRAGEIDVMANVDLFGEGFDVPGIVDCGLARPTKSLALHLQQVGRALRVVEGKERAIICDHAGNWATHGLPDDARSWTLKGREGRKSAPKPGEMSIRQCLDCYQVSSSTATICPCGTPFPVKARAVDQEAGELFEIDRAAMQKRAADIKHDAAKVRAQEERECKTVNDLIELAKARGYSNPRGWAYHKMQLRQKWKGRKAA